MLSTYQSLEEVRKASLLPHIEKIVATCIENLLEAYGDDYDPDDDGYVVLCTPETTDQDALDLFGRTWTDALLEGVTFDAESECFLTCVLCNNQYGYTIVVPDAEWLPPAFRAKLREEMI